MRMKNAVKERHTRTEENKEVKSELGTENGECLKVNEEKKKQNTNIFMNLQGDTYGLFCKAANRLCLIAVV